MTENSPKNTGEHIGRMPDFAVVDNLIDMLDGKKVGQNLASQIISSGCSRVVIIGEPGAGKTTVSNQLGAEILALSDSSLDISPMQYDQNLDARQKLVKSRDVEKNTYERWDHKDWQDFDVAFGDKIKKLKPVPGNQQSIQLIELPVPGNHPVKTRAKGTLEMIAREFGQNTKFIYIAADIGTQHLATEIRLAIRNMPPKDVIGFLRTKKILMVGMEDNSKNGRKIRSGTRKMANAQHIRAIRSEFFHQAMNWLDSHKTGLDALKLPGSVSMGSEDMKQDNPILKIKAAYMQAYLQEDLQIPQTNICILFNQYDPNRYIYIYPQVAIM